MTSINSGNLQIGNGGTGGSILGNVAVSTGSNIIFNRSDNTYYSGVISGAGGLNKMNSNSLTLANDNTFTGVTQVTGGLQIGNGSTTGSIQGNIINDGFLSFNKSSTTIYPGVLSGTGSLSTLGEGTIILTGENTYTGSTSILGNGNLQVGNGGTAGSILSDVNADSNGKLVFKRSNTVTYPGVFSGSGSLSQEGTVSLVLTGSNTNTGTTDILSGTLAIGNGGTTGSLISDINNQAALVFNRSNNTSYEGIISGPGTVLKQGANTLSLTGNSTYTGNTTIAAGVLQIGDGNTSGSLISDITNNSALNFNRSDSSIYTGVVSGSGSLNQVGNGTTILTGENTYSGNTIITSGTLQLGNGGSTGSILGNVTNNSALSFNRNDTKTYSNIISGTGSVYQIGTGVTNLNAVNTYTGGTYLQGGYLEISNDNNLGSVVAPLIFDGGALKISTNLNLNNSRAINITASSGIIDTNGFDTTISQGITGTGFLNKVGAGTLTLAGANNYNGTVISSGAVQIGDGGSTGSVAGSITNNSNLIFNRSDAVTHTGFITGSGSLTKLGSDILTLTNNNNYTGDTNINSGALQIGDGLTSGSVTGNINNNAALIFNRSDLIDYNGSISGPGTVSQNGIGTLKLSGLNSYTGGTLLNSGITQISQDENLGAVSSDVVFNSGILQLGTNANLNSARSLVINTTGTFDTNGFNSTLTSAISGSAGTSFIKSGLGDLNITSDSTGFTGDTLINQGRLGLNGTLGGNVVLNDGTLYGNGTAFGNAILNGGIIAPGNSIGTIHINGNYIQNPGSTYLVEVDSTASDLIDVDGTATINGGTVQVFTLSQPSLDTPYTILHADGGVTGAFDNLILPNNFFDATLTYNPFDVLLGIVQDLINGAQTQNQITIASQLNNVIKPPSKVDQLISTLFSMSDEEIRHVLDLLAGSQYTHLLQVSQYSVENFSRRIWDSVRNLQFVLGCSYNDNDSFRGWFDVDARNAFQKGNAEAKGYRLDSHDILAGFEKQFNSRFFIGSAFDYENDYLHFNLSGHGKAHTYQGALYALYTAPKYYLFSDLSIGHRSMKVKRNIDSSSIHLTAKSKPELVQSLFYTEIGFNTKMNNVNVQPFVGIEVGNYYRKKIKEHGASSFDLSIKSQNRFTTNSRIGLHFYTYLPFGITLGGDLAWKHRFNFVDDHFKAHFRDFGTDFLVLGVKRNRDSIEANINMSQTLNDLVQIYADVFGQRESRYSAYGVSCGFNIRW